MTTDGSKYLYCKNCEKTYCKIIKHRIENGYASIAHCSECKYFILNPKRKKKK